MHRRSKEIVDTDRSVCKEETVPPDDVVDGTHDAAKLDHPLDQYRIYNTVIGALVFGYYY
ncbi:hypothetical protein MKX03_013564, partial [Papaver bracteatum]